MVYVIQIEGNIGVGKSTLINYLKSKLSKHKIIFINEPINSWMNIEDIIYFIYMTLKEKIFRIISIYLFYDTIT